MISPRVFHYLDSPSSRNSRTMGTRSARNPALARPQNRQPSRSSPPSPTMLAHSKPVVIPPRSSLRSVTSTQTVRAKGHHGARSTRSKTHDPDAIPPAVAALLALTTIPKMPPRRRKRSTMDRSISMDELIQEWKQDDCDSLCSFSGSPLDILLDRVDTSESDYGSLPSMEQDRERFRASRSISSESLSTLPPSLEFDSASYSSQWDNISTPDSVGRKTMSDRKEKAVSSPPKEDCILDHPLLHFNAEDPEEFTPQTMPDVLTVPPANARFKSFKSNLTASLQAIKDAAKSFSNFTAPSVPPEDLLTRSLLAPRFTSEMRPKHLEELPSPALRRYLNPQSPPISPTELSMQLHDALSIDSDNETNAPMIQMQTYDRRGRSRKGRRGSEHTPEDRSQSPTPTVRQREPRENSDFLRVIVLEMNMRRVGKLDTRAIGKARVWLPPRKMESSRSPSLHTGGVPERWLGTAA